MSIHGQEFRLTIPDEMPDDLKVALREVHTEAEVLNCDHANAVRDQDFEQAARFRDWADRLKKRIQTIMDEWTRRNETQADRAS